MASVPLFRFPRLAAAADCKALGVTSGNGRSSRSRDPGRPERSGGAGIRADEFVALSMSRCSSFLANAVSRTVVRSTLVPQARGARVQTSCLFGGLFPGRKKRENAVDKESAPKAEFRYHEDVPVPFPPSLLASTFLAGKELRCCYKATVDGFGAMTFHQRCDFKGPCVIIGRTAEGQRVGAFNPEGYRSTDDYYDSFDAFLFYWPTASTLEPSSPSLPFSSPGPSSKVEEDLPVVLPKVGGSGAALFDYARGGPQFGADGLLIGPPLSPVMGGLSGPETDSGKGQGQLSEARSRLGLSYARRPDGKDSLFGDKKRVTLVEIEVFCCPAIADLY